MKSRCPGCAVELDGIDGPTDPYGGSSPACWAAYGIVMARAFSDEGHLTARRLSVDAYMAQHPSRGSRAAVQSVWVHLVGLCLVIERGVAPTHVARVMAQLTRFKRASDWLEPPLLEGITAKDVASATGPEEHAQATRRWAEFVWGAWRPHYAAIRALTDCAVR